MNNRNKNCGQSLLEIIVALGIFLLAASAAFQIFFGGRSLSVDSANVGLATDYLQEGAAAVKEIRNRNWNELTDGDHGLAFQNNNWMFASSSASDARGIFTRTISVAPGNNPNIKIATTTISWQTDPLRPQKIEIVEYLTNWEELAYSSCKLETLSGNWAAPQSIGSGDLGPGNEGTDVLVKDQYAYISGTASAASKPDLFVFDISNPNSPSLVGSLDIGAGGINSIFIKGNYLYGASPNNTKELVIINISSPSSPSLTGTYDLSGNADGLSVIAFSNTVALGRDSSATNEIAFINVSDPASPSLISESSPGANVMDFAATTDKLFVMTKVSDGEVRIFNITNPASPSFISSYDIPAMSNGLSVYLYYKGGGLHLLSGNGENELVLVGATTTSQMYVRSRLNVGGAVNDIVCVADNLAFLSTTNSTKEFIIVDVLNPDLPVEYASLNYPQVATGIDFLNNKVFMSVRSNDSLRTISSQ